MVQDMTESNNDMDASKMKKAWVVYALIILLVIIALVFLVAEDNEERLFFTLMTAAASYGFRPTDRFMKKKIAQFSSSSENTDNK